MMKTRKYICKKKRKYAIVQFRLEKYRNFCIAYGLKEGENLLEEIISNTYDVNGKKILRSVKRYEDGVYAYGGRIRFTYNAEGFVCLVESCDDTDIYRVTNKFSYSYDKYGNFTVENNFNDFFPLIKERTIIYY